MSDKPQLPSQAELERQRNQFIEKMIEVWRKQKRKEHNTEGNNTQTAPEISATIVKSADEA